MRGPRRPAGQYVRTATLCPFKQGKGITVTDSQQLRERTLVVLKPDAVVRGLAGRIIQRFEDASLKVIGVKMREMDADFAR